MPHTDSGLPFSGAIDVSRHHSFKGAEAAKERALPQVLRYLELLMHQYPDGYTDVEAAELLGVERSTINARRGECTKAGLIQAHGARPGKYDCDNVVWRFKVPAERREDR